MAAPLVLDALFDLAGPFLFPVALFVLGAVGYGLLVALGRLELVENGRGRSDGAADDPRSPSDDDV